MKDWEHTLITPEAILRDALDVIDKAGLQIAIVIDTDPYLVDKLIEGCSKSPSFSSRELFQAPPRFSSRRVNYAAIRV